MGIVGGLGRVSRGECNFGGVENVCGSMAEGGRLMGGWGEG